MTLMERYAIQTGKTMKYKPLKLDVTDEIDVLILERMKIRELLQEQTQKKILEQEIEKKITKAIEKAFRNI